MKLNRTNFFLIFFLQLLILSCSKCPDVEEISGEYYIGNGGYVLNPEIMKGIRCLLLRSDKTFTLYEVMPLESGAISGTWEIKSCKTVEISRQTYVESILQFKIKNKTTNAKCFGKSKVIFDRPEEFYGDKGKTLKYSKPSENI